MNNFDNPASNGRISNRGGNDFSLPTSQTEQPTSAPSRSSNLYRRIAYLPQWPNPWGHMPHHGNENHLNSPHSWGQFHNYAQAEKMSPLLEGNNQIPMAQFSPLDGYYPSMPSSPDSESPGAMGEVSFPELADMRSGAGISNSGEIAVSDPSKEERKLQRRRERNRASQRAFRLRKEKYVQDLESHYLELRRRYEDLLGVMKKARSEAPGEEGGWCGMEEEEKNGGLVATTSEFEIEIC